MGEPGAATGEGPNMGPSVRGLGMGGIPMKKKVMPKASPKKLAEKTNWKSSFKKFSSKMGGKKGQ
jgi:hypothetical protein